MVSATHTMETAKPDVKAVCALNVLRHVQSDIWLRRITPDFAFKVVLSTPFVWRQRRPVTQFVLRPYRLLTAKTALTGKVGCLDIDTVSAEGYPLSYVA